MLHFIFVGVALLSISRNHEVEGRFLSKTSELEDVLDFLEMDTAKKSAVCHANGEDYTEGQLIYIPDNYDSIHHATCQQCLCKSGATSDCKTIHCELEQSNRWCQQYGAVPRGECCPKCECTHNGQVMPEGSSWVNKTGNDCRECTCDGGQASCKSTKVLCQVCSNPIPSPDQCCDICPNPATTATPVVVYTLPPTTTRPPFVLPPRFPGRKRSLTNYNGVNKRKEEKS